MQMKLYIHKKLRNSETYLPKLGGFWLAFVDKRFLDVIGGVELRGLLCRSCVLGFGIVMRETAAVFRLNCPETSLVVHL